MIVKIKKIVQKYSGMLSVFRYIPFSVRLGKDYNFHKKQLVDYDSKSAREKDDYHYRKLKKIVEYAYENIHFYKFYYNSKGFEPSDFKSLSDFSKVPIITKSDLKKFDLSQRSNLAKKAMKINTGGTSGAPLDFFVDENAFAREWAYMHSIWSKLEYTYLDLKLTFRGKNNGGRPLKYNVVHNEYIVDAYIPICEVVEAIQLITKELTYIHGYPSAIYSFCKYLKDKNIDVSSVFKTKLKGVFLGSEYPAPHYRKLIEEVLKAPTLSWYGHSEMSILAYEKMEHFKYFPLQTYGFVESVPTEIEHENRLIGTSYDNINSPFIRYDTGDLVKNEVYENDILAAFEISSGRVGDFILDELETPISLTAIIFGRHHDAFNVIDFVQVEQKVKGKAILYIVSQKDIDISSFDFDNVNITFELKFISSPYLTKSGKVSLLIKNCEQI
jgi:phenylacetate-CoA ligase